MLAAKLPPTIPPAPNHQRNDGAMAATATAAPIVFNAFIRAEEESLGRQGSSFHKVIVVSETSVSCIVIIDPSQSCARSLELSQEMN